MNIRPPKIAFAVSLAVGYACVLVASLPAHSSLTPAEPSSSRNSLVGNNRAVENKLPSTDALCGLQVAVEFREGAPRDRFEFVNASTHGWQIQGISLRLESTAGKLVFDTEAGGKGVEVYQLFQVESGTAKLGAAQLPEDGANRLDLAFSRFESGDTFTFSIDVDDQLVTSELGQIRVSDSEIAGGIVALSVRDQSGQAHDLDMVFDTQSRSGISVPAC